MYISLVILIVLLAFIYLYCFVVITNTTTESRENNTIRRTHVFKNLHAKKNFHVPKFMLELYERNKERDIARADVVRSLIPKHAGQIEGNEVFTASTSETHILVFDLPLSDEDEALVCAELKVLTLVVSGEEVDNGVKRKLKLSTYSDYLRDLLGFQELLLHHLNNTWLTFDLTRSVQQVLGSQSKFKYLTVTLTVSDFGSDRNGRLSLSLVPDEEGEENFEFEYPVLVLSYASSKDRRRVKRSVEDDYEEETNKLWDEDADRKYKKLKRMRNNCRRRPLYVDFAEINYDSWIVQPKGYEAFQCLGRCFYPVAEHLNPTKHAIVQALLHSVSPAKVPRSCCVPTLLDSISILYVDINGVLTYRYAYKDMVVVECGCR